MSDGKLRLFEALAEMCELYPDWRLGQMLANVTDCAKHPNSPQQAAEAMWDIEDEELLAAALAHIKRRREKLATSEPAA